MKEKMYFALSLAIFYTGMIGIAHAFRPSLVFFAQASLFGDAVIFFVHLKSRWNKKRTFRR